MFAFFKNEFKAELKSLLIWSLAVGGMGLACILLYKSMEGSMEEMAQSMATMGAFADAFGMSTLSIATLKGYFATEIGTIHSLGGSLFAASVATVILSKEEDSHTADYTFALPLSRKKIMAMKYLNVFVSLVIFAIICALLYVLGFIALGEKEMGTEFVQFMFYQLVMSVEISSICLFISAISKKNKLGLGISIAMLLYAYDLIVRVIPKLKNVIFLSPFSYANATNIFANKDIDIKAIVCAVFCILFFSSISWLYYDRKDLSC